MWFGSRLHCPVPCINKNHSVVKHCNWLRSCNVFFFLLFLLLHGLCISACRVFECRLESCPVWSQKSLTNTGNGLTEVAKHYLTEMEALETPNVKEKTVLILIYVKSTDSLKACFISYRIQTNGIPQPWQKKISSWGERDPDMLCLVSVARVEVLLVQRKENQRTLDQTRCRLSASWQNQRLTGRNLLVPGRKGKSSLLHRVQWLSRYWQ